MRTVKMSRWTLVLVFLAWAATAGAQTIAGEPTTRPFRISGELTFLDIGGGSPMTVADMGVASHLGAFFGAGEYAGFTGSGMYFLADGSQLFWRDAGDSEGVIEFTGGTGRFQNASGSFTFTMGIPRVVPGPNGTLNYVATYTGEGTIRY